MNNLITLLFVLFAKSCYSSNNYTDDCYTYKHIYSLKNNDDITSTTRKPSFTNNFTKR